MMEELNILEEQIIRYLEHEMSIEERQAFEMQLNQDKQLQGVLEEYKVILKGIELAGDNQLRSSIQKVNDELEAENFFSPGKKEPESHAKIRNFRWMKYAVAALILIGMMTFIIKLSNKPVNGAEIFATYYKVDSNQVRMEIKANRTSGLIPSFIETDSFATALELYLEGKYNESIYLLESRTDSFRNSEIAQYYLALNYLALKNYKVSEPILGKLCGDSLFILHEDACWYRVLIWIHQDQDTENIKFLLNQFSSSTNPDRVVSSKRILAYYQ
ncbi:MAG: hypothetical protein ABIO44_12310 [Saprospiraceae bacterium]